MTTMSCVIDRDLFGLTTMTVIRVDRFGSSQASSVIGILWLGLFHSFEYTKQNYFPMTLLPTLTFTSINSILKSNIADLLSKHLPHTRFASAIEAIHPYPPVAIDPAFAVDPLATVAAPLFDTGASLSVCYPLSVLLLSVDQVSYGLNRSPLESSISDPYTLITGETDNTVEPSDLSFPDYSEVSFTFQEFGTATLIYIHSRSTLELLNILVEPSLDPVVDWLHWIPLPRLTPTGTYFHISGLDYLQAFALFHLIPIWITLVLALLPFRFE